MTSKTILLIDDDDDFLTLLRNRCEGIGLKVEKARNLLSATLIMAKRAPDIICVDVEMPTGNGLVFCKGLAADPATSQIPVIVATGQSSVEVRNECERLHAFYVHKSGDFWPSLESILRQLAASTVLPGTHCWAREGEHRREPNVPIPLPPNTMFASNSGKSSAKKIVIADDDHDMLQLLSQRFSSLGCSVVGADNALDAINVIHRFAPDLVCLDIGMPSGNGLSVCEMMASDADLRQTPIIVLTGRSDDETIRRCHDMMVYYVQKSADTWKRVAPLAFELLRLDTASLAAKPESSRQSRDATKPAQEERQSQELIDAVFAALGANLGDGGDNVEPETASSAAARLEEVPWILCIDDDADFSDALRTRLEEHGVAVVRAFNGMEGYRLAFTSPASAILLDCHMPNGEGDYILGRLKDNPVTKDIPVIVISGTRDRVLQRRMIALGAVELFEKPINFEKLRERLASYIDILRPRTCTRGLTSVGDYVG